MNLVYINLFYSNIPIYSFYTTTTTTTTILIYYISIYSIYSPINVN